MNLLVTSLNCKLAPKKINGKIILNDGEGAILKIRLFFWLTVYIYVFFLFQLW